MLSIFSRYGSILNENITSYIGFGPLKSAPNLPLDPCLKEFQDQYDNLAHYTNKSIDFLDVLANFIRQRCAVEVEYAAKIRRLTKGFVPKKVKDDDYHQFSYTKAFLTMLNEMNDIAGQHEVVSENLTSSVVNHLTDLVKSLKEERKKCLIDGSKLKQKLIDQEECLIKSKKNYEKTYRESIKAQQNYEKADADFNLSRAEVEKQRTNSQIKTKLSEDAKSEYAGQLKKFNELQRRHFTQDLPSIFDQLQEIESKRICQYRDFIKASVDISQKVLPILNTCYENVANAADAIEPDKDTKLVIDKYKSGFSIPEDEIFQDLSEDNTDSISMTGTHKPNGILNGSDKHNHNHTSQSTLAGRHYNGTTNASSCSSYHRTDTGVAGGVKGTLSKSRLLVTASGRKRGGLFSLFGSQKDDFSDLPPNQRRKKLQTKLDAVNAQIAQETAARDAMLRMREVYQQNPSMGNPYSIDGQLSENGQKLEKLKAEVAKLEAYLADVESRIPPGRPNLPPGGGANGTSPTLSAQGSEGSGGSAFAPSQQTTSSQEEFKVKNYPSSTSPAPTPLAEPCEYGASPGDYGENGGGSLTEFYDLPVLGTCTALYPFDGESEGSIPMTMAEEFEVVELDQGDGWTRVRRKNSSSQDERDGINEGFVPTTYVEIVLFGNSSPNSCPSPPATSTVLPNTSKHTI